MFKEIIDFGSQKIFPGINTYCCITVFSKSNKDFFRYNNEIIKYEDYIFDYNNGYATIKGYNLEGNPVQKLIRNLLKSKIE